MRLHTALLFLPLCVHAAPDVDAVCAPDIDLIKYAKQVPPDAVLHIVVRGRPVTLLHYDGKPAEDYLFQIGGEGECHVSVAPADPTVDYKRAQGPSPPTPVVPLPNEIIGGPTPGTNGRPDAMAILDAIHIEKVCGIHMVALEQEAGTPPDVKLKILRPDWPVSILWHFDPIPGRDRGRGIDVLFRTDPNDDGRCIAQVGESRENASYSVHPPYVLNY